MTEGTRLRDLSDHLKVVEEKVQALTLGCNQILESKFQQFEADNNKKLGVMVQQLDNMQKEAQQRFEAQQIESIKRHDQLLKMFNSQSYTSNSASHSTPPFKENRPSYDYSNNSNTRPVDKDSKGKGILPSPQWNHEGNQGNQGQRNSYYTPHPKLDYPTFEGDEPREWISKSE